MSVRASLKKAEGAKNRDGIGSLLRGLSAALHRSSTISFVAIAMISTVVAIFSFLEVSNGFNQFIADTDARKTARETLVEILSEESALRLYSETRNPLAAKDYREARRAADALTKRVRNYVLLQKAPSAAFAFARFERTTGSMSAELDTILRHKGGQGSTVPGDIFAKLALCKLDLVDLVQRFNVSGTLTVRATKKRILLGGFLSAGSTVLLGFAAIFMERLRRRAQRRRATEIEANIVEREKAEAAALRADALEAGRALLEREVGDRTRAEERMAFVAFHDELTGLPNRALFMNRLSHMAARRERASEHLSAVLFLDLDRFKVVNDSLGHLVGDLLLTAVARRLETCLRGGDTLARLGGDEFTILLDDVSDERAACTIAQRVLDALEAPFNCSGHEVFANASIGIAVSKTGSCRPEDLLRDADIAMYRAKERGKQRYELCTPELLTRAVNLLEVQTDLRRALERNEFRLLYQPIFALPSRRITSFEALIRWEHPRRGLLTPAEFIGIAEDSGAIGPIGEWVLASACRQMRSWRDELQGAKGIRVNVNVSAKQLVVPGFERIVERVLIDSGLTADGLNVEITESVIMDQPEAAQATLQALRDVGVGIHVDDFGTGYSSLAYLHRFPIDALKVDRSFVSTSGTDVANPEIVATIIALARNLSIDATVEGVETEQQLVTLKTLGCASAQGYYFSLPIDATAAGALLAAQLQDSANFKHQAVEQGRGT